MTPDCARRLLEAWRNHHRPARTCAARVRDAVLHVEQSHAQRKSPGNDQGLNIHTARNEYDDELHANYKPSDPNPHL